MVEQQPFCSPADVFDWLGQFVNLEQGVMPPSMRPERMGIIAEAAGHPEKSAPAIHIAGSKGKGSITAVISAILTEAGFRVGRYMSPHVEDYRERITLDDAYFDDAIYLSSGERLRTVERELARRDGRWYKALVDVSDGGAAEPTFFELLTLYFFLCAQEAACDVFVVETGMGGRLDPTNISESVCAVITGIEMEHTDMLGDTIRKIAAEKAGIIKAGKPVLVAEQKHPDGRDALDVFITTAGEKAAPLFYLPEYARIENVVVSQAGTSWTYSTADGAFTAGLRIPVPGAVQAENASAAISAIRIAFPAVTAEQMRRGLARVQPPARFEKLHDNPVVIVDGAHTDLSVQLCAETWRELYGGTGVLIFGCAMGKDVEAMARALLPHFRDIFITKPGTYKISEPETIFATFKKIAAETGGTAAEIHFIAETPAAIKSAIELAQAGGRPI
ncbi:MAG: tetrahydrofolate synthase, partial [Spirochaetaceae bacterium]|nr:tetrahydrofolate synthase [Spirochaetaceae bacterium]